MARLEVSPHDVQRLPDDELGGHLLAGFGVTATAVETVTGGTEARVWRVGTDDGRTWAARWSLAGVPVGQHVAAAFALDCPGGGQAVPARATDGSLGYACADGTLTLTSWLDGPTAIAEPLTAPTWFALGRLVGRLHAVDPAVVPGLPVVDFTPGWWRGTFDAVERARDVPAVDDRARAVLETWDASRRRVLLVREHTERIGHRLHELQRHEPTALPMVVCHGDPHQGNVVVTGPGSVALVDWDSAVLAPAEHDLMFVLGGTYSARPVTEQDAAEFFTGYGRVDIDDDRLAYARGVRLLEDASDWARRALDPARPDEERDEAHGILRTVLGPDGLVDLVLG
ncbi:phosphotransferase enzyme family protein [Cellulomonas rhizosphaerae]|uniref:phosphotransferase enzyme family protein n=1 Tax=Cellulomonas rhizosphaerae TaxID=2293719 RepID=UPI0013146940|nr:aminoglycoside phosphotransferase family protein [Cellulomonas rhizosphaerae]